MKNYKKIKYYNNEKEESNISSFSLQFSIFTFQKCINRTSKFINKI